MGTERVLDDIWANQGGVSVRVVVVEVTETYKELRIEFTDKGIGKPAVHVATLTDYRARRLAEALGKEFPRAERTEGLREALADAVALAGMLTDNLESRGLLPYYVKVARTALPALRAIAADHRPEQAAGDQ